MNKRRQTNGAAAPPPGSAVLTGGVPRFVLAERLAHWLYALLFLICLVSGLLMWIPATRDWLGEARHGVALRHAAMGFAMVVVPLLISFLLDRKRLASNMHEVDAWDTDDRRWFWAALRGRTLRGGVMPPQGRFNAGQKANTILVAAMALGFALTGALLLAKADLPAWLVSRALWLHDFLAIAGMALLAGHLAHVFLTSHGRGYLRGMLTGRLAEEIARERHEKWWAQITLGSSPGAGGHESQIEGTEGQDGG
jgi:formate dehydrogenase subunit gamma